MSGSGPNRRVIVAVVAGVLVVAAGWTAYALWSGVRAAQQLRDQIHATSAPLRAMRFEAVAEDLPALDQAASDLVAAVNTPPWFVLSRLPFVGASFASVRELATAADLIADAAQQVKPVVHLVEPGVLRAADGTINLTALSELSAALQRAQPILADAAAAVERADPGAVGPIGALVATARDQVLPLPTTAADAARATALATRLLGAQGAQRWVVLLQNGSEARGTGGFLGAYSLVRANGGRLRTSVVDTNNSLTTPIPNRDLPREFLDLWTAEYTSEWNSFNLSRHFPYTGQLTYNGMAARDTPIQHVLAIDAHVVAGLLAGTGPITASGETITQENAERFFNAEVYAKYPDTAEKDAVVVALMKALMREVISGEFDVWAAVRAVQPMAAQGRVSMWSSEADVQAEVEHFTAAGLVPEGQRPWVATALNNSAANKLDAFMATSVTYDAHTCGSGESSVTVTLTNNTPSKGSGEAFSRFFAGQKFGATRMWTAVYGPVDAEFSSATIDGRRQFVHQGYERGHPVWRWNIDIPRGETRTLVVRFSEPASDVTPYVDAQAMAVPQTTSVSSICE